MKKAIVFLLFMNNVIVTMEPQGCTWRGDNIVTFKKKVEDEEKGINAWFLKDGVAVVVYSIKFDDFYRQYELRKSSFKPTNTFNIDFYRNVYSRPCMDTCLDMAKQISDCGEQESLWLQDLYRHKHDLRLYGSETLMIARSNSIVYVWDRIQKKQTALLIHSFGSINSLSFDKNSEKIMTASDDGVVCFWDKAGKTLLRVDLEKPINFAWVDDENAEIIVMTRDHDDMYILVQEYLDDFNNNLKT